MSSNLIQTTQPQPLALTSPDFYSQACTSLDAVKTLGEWIAHSGMFGCVKPEQGYVLALECIASGMTPLSWQRENHLISGNITMKSDSMLSGLLTAVWAIAWQAAKATTVIANCVAIRMKSLPV